MNPMITRAALVVVGCAALIAAIIDGDRKTPIVVRYVVSTDAVEILGPLIAEFNEAGETSAGRRIEVQMQDRDKMWVKVTRSLVDEQHEEDNIPGTASGDALRGIGEGTLQPVAWTPASSLWEKLLEAETEVSIVDEPSTSLLQSPQVVAMLEDERKELSLLETEPLRTILDLAVDGDLKLAHTDPNISTSGLSAVYSEFSLAASSCDKTLTVRTVGDETCVRPEVGEIEESIVHYIDIANDAITQWCTKSNNFADAAYMQETTFLKANADEKGKCGGPDQFVAIYPTDIALVADYPYIVLDAEWAKSRQQEAAEAFGGWLDERLRADCPWVARHNYRKGRCTPPGVDPDKGARPRPSQAPATVLAEVQAAWGELRRPGNVILVVDQSSQMANQGRLAALERALITGEGSEPPFVDCPRSQDRVGMIVYGDNEKSVLVEAVARTGGSTSISERLVRTRARDWSR